MDNVVWSVLHGIGSILASPLVPAWLGFLAILATCARVYPAVLARINERRRDNAAEKAKDWERLRDEVQRLATRVETLERKVEECELERDHYRNEAAEERASRLAAEAQLVGRGNAKQEAQRMLSEERELDAKARKSE